MTEWNEGRLDELNERVQGIGQRMDEGIVQLNRIDERVEQLDKRVDQLDSRIGRFESNVDSRFTDVGSRFSQLESQIDARFGRVESGISQIQNQFRELQHTLVQMTWALVVALLVVLGGVITAQL